MDIQNKLLSLQEENYRDFQAKLMPTVNPQTILGVRVPLLRALAKEINGTKEAEGFLRALPHIYYEENNLHAFLIEKISDFDTCVEELGRFLPYIDNWATCDMMNPPVLRQNPVKLYERILLWLTSGHVYTVRFALGMLQRHFLGENFSKEHLTLAADACCEEYYINMMVAWYFATALTVRYEETLPVLQENMLPVWVHNKTIQKAVESCRISVERKAFLRTLRRKNKKMQKK